MFLQNVFQGWNHSCLRYKFLRAPIIGTLDFTCETKDSATFCKLSISQTIDCNFIILDSPFYYIERYDSVHILEFSNLPSICLKFKRIHQIFFIQSQRSQIYLMNNRSSVKNLLKFLQYVIRNQCLYFFYTSRDDSIPL